MPSFMADSPAEEANRQLISVWNSFALRYPGGHVAQLEGVNIAWADVQAPFLNMAVLSSPVTDALDLGRRVAATLEFAVQRRRPWFFLVCWDWIPEALAADAEGCFLAHGLVRVTENTGMIAETLLPPSRRLPATEIRPVRCPETRRAVGEINALAYEIPLRWGVEATEIESLWDERTFGALAFVEGRPVSCAVTFVSDGRLYVAYVATLPEYRGYGYAETAMRECLERAARASGFARSVLHATPAGRPLYERMGFRDAARYILYAQPH